jgi:hypothetical protein
MGLEYITGDNIRIIQIVYTGAAKVTASGVNEIIFRKLSATFAGNSRFVPQCEHAVF